MERQYSDFEQDKQSYGDQPVGIDAAWIERIRREVGALAATDEALRAVGMSPLSQNELDDEFAEQIEAAGEIRRIVLSEPYYDDPAPKQVGGSSEFKRADYDEAISTSRLIALPDHGRTLVPAFQLDSAGTPIAIVEEVNSLMGAAEDPWGVAGWWLTARASSDGVQVKELISDTHRWDELKHIAEQLLTGD